MTDHPHAVVLAGGRASRMGGVAKPALEVHGESLLARTVAALRAEGVERIVVAGPHVADVEHVQWVREDPAYGGPVAGLAAALAHVDAPWTLVLAGDLVHPARVVAALAEAPRAPDGAHLVDADGRAQWLAGVYRTAAVRSRMRELGADVRDASMRAVLAGLDLAAVDAPRGATDDVDTWENLDAARRRVPNDLEEGRTMPDQPNRTLPPEALDEWARALRERFALSDDDLPIALILDLARDVANGVARPAAPFSAFVAGLVAGRAGGTPEDVRASVAAITELANAWPER